MENYLKEINGVIGVIGSFVCLSDGSIAAKKLPEKFDDAGVEAAARTAIQTFNALEAAGQRVVEADLVYGQGRLMLKNLRGGILIIVCARNINTPLLNLTANLVAKKLSVELKPKATPTSTPAASTDHPKITSVSRPTAPAITAPPASAPALATPVVPTTRTALQSTPVPATEIAPSALYVELEKESQRLRAAATNSQITLCVMDPIALWACCTETRQWVSMPQKRHIDFCAASEQAGILMRLFDQLGYEINQRFHATHGNERLHFDDPQRFLSADIYLDAFAMYHRFSLKPILASGASLLPETQLAIIRLQIVEVTDAELRDLCALFLEHNLAHSSEPGAIDETQISKLCADDWGWYKTIKMNLERLVEFADNHLSPTARDTVTTRVRQIQSGIEIAPKSLRWLARARIGETVRWYETPITASATERADQPIR
jgi:hypothetical protein